MMSNEFILHLGIIETINQKPVLAQLVFCSSCKNRFFFPNHIGLIKSLECCPFCGLKDCMEFEYGPEVLNFFGGQIPAPITTCCSRCLGPIGLLEDPTVFQDIKVCPYCQLQFEESVKLDSEDLDLEDFGMV